MIVYRITNIINGKSYIGQTIHSKEKRFSQHCSRSEGCVYLNNAIVKYGRKNFKIAVLSRCGSIEEMNHREKYYIKLFDTLSPNGYNLRSGGRKNSLPSKSTLEKMTFANKKKMENSETRRKISVSLKEYYVNNPNARFIHSLKIVNSYKNNSDLREKMSISRGGKPFLVLKKDTKEIVWKGINQAECGLSLNVNPANINACLKLKKKSCNGYIFRYENEANIPWHKTRSKKSVVNRDTGEKFKTVSCAAKKYSTCTSNISRAIRTKTKAAGYNWEYIKCL